MAVPFKIDLRGKTAVVTGGGGVLCSAFCEALAECGASVAVLDLTVERAAATADRIRAQGGQALPLGADVLDRESLQKALVQIEASFGAVDILINGAGGNNPKAQTTKEYLFPEDLDGGPGRERQDLFRPRSGRGEFCVQPQLSRHAASDAGLCKRVWPSAAGRSSISRR